MKRGNKSKNSFVSVSWTFEKFPASFQVAAKPQYDPVFNSNLKEFPKNTSETANTQNGKGQTE